MLCANGHLQWIGRLILILLLVGTTGCSKSRRDPDQARNDEASDSAGDAQDDQPEDSDPSDDPPEASGPLTWKQIINRADDSVVYIVTLDALGNEAVTGSGFLIDRQRHVATNFHVLTQAITAYAQFKDGQKSDVLGYTAVDADSDLAIVRLSEVPSSARPYDLRDPISLEQGDELAAVGHPSGFKFTVTTGIVSAVRQTDELPEDYRRFLNAPDDHVWIQTNAAISGGNSGGPLLSQRGELVGINTWIAEGQNLGFATHVRHLRQLAARASDQPREFPIPGLGLIADMRVTSLVNDYAKEYRVFLTKLQAADSEWKQNLIIKREHPAPEYVDECISLAEEEPGTKAAEEALRAACDLLAYATDTDAWETRQDKVFELLATHHALDTDAAHLCVSIAGTSSSPSAQEFFKKVIRQNPDAASQGAACYGLAASLQMNPTGERRFNEKKLSRQATALLSRAMKEFGDAKVGARPLKAIVEPLFKADRIKIGRRAPEITGKDLDSNELRLSDYRGKVVLLDFWADWCPYCREAYEHGRGLVEKYTDKPFVVLGVNSDQLERARRVKADGLVNWRSWYDGPEGEIGNEWQVSSIPTTYLLDQDGVIRFFNLRGEQIEQAVDLLLSDRKLSMPNDVLSKSATWTYYHGEAVPPSDWYTPDFDDSSWDRGAGILGQGQGDETTKLNLPAIGRDRPLRAYFRTTFQVAEPDGAKLLLLSSDDPCIVHVNGAELLRSAIRLDAEPDDPPVFELGGGDIAIVVPASMLQKTNTLAVEIRQEDVWAPGLRLEASISSGWEDLLKEQLGEPDAPRRRLGGLVWEIGAPAAPLTPVIEQYLGEASEPWSIITAFCALKSIAPDREVQQPPGAKTWSEMQQRKQAAEHFSNASRRRVAHAGLSEYDYLDAYKSAVCASALSPKKRDYVQTLAVALFRMGRHSEAQQVLAELSERDQNRPLTQVIAALNHHALEEHDEARSQLASARETMAASTSKKFLEDEFLQQLLTEAEELAGSSESADLSAAGR